MLASRVRTMFSHAKVQLCLTLAAVFVAAVFGFGWRLGQDSIMHVDGALHVMVTREMRQSGNWWNLTIHHSEYNRKPPLAFWIRAVVESVMGENDVAARLPSVAAGVLTAVLLAWWMWEWRRRWIPTLLVGIAFPLLSSGLLHTFRAEEADGLLIFFVTLAFYLLWKSFRRPWHLVTAGAVFGLAFMDKSEGAFIIPVLFLGTLATVRRWPYQWKHVWSAIAAAAVIILPWHIYQTIREGTAFWSEYIGFHVVDRIATRLHNSPQHHGTWWYIPVMVRDFFPWSTLLPAALLWHGTHKREEEDDDRLLSILLAWWGIGTVLLYTIAATKLAWYIAPAYPALLMLVVRWLTEKNVTARVPRWLYPVVLLGIAVYFWHISFNLNTGVLGILSLSWMQQKMATGVVFGVGVLLFAITFLKPRWYKVLTVTTIIFITLHMVITAFGIHARSLRMVHETWYRQFSRVIAARDTTATILMYKSIYETNSFAWYYLEDYIGKRHLVFLDPNETDLTVIAKQYPGAYLIADVGQIPAGSIFGTPIQKVRLVEMYKLPE